MKWVMRIIQGLLAVVFILAGIVKLIGQEKQVQMFTKTFDYSLWFMYVIGIGEILVGIGLIAGFWKSRLTFSASILSVMLMAGAVISHINAGEKIGEVMPSILLMILGLVTFIGKRLMISKKEQSYLGS
ncbi:MAG TPA: DoxX family protein [Metabacillus sp.]|nr:DoxX family protein [Metabacillus sp.]